MRHIEVGFCLGAVSGLRFFDNVIGGSVSAHEENMNRKIIYSAEKKLISTD